MSPTVSFCDSIPMSVKFARLTSDCSELRQPPEAVDADDRSGVLG